MVSKLSDTEAKMDELFVRNAPGLPKGAKKALVAWLPLISAVVGVLSLWAAWNLWHWAHLANHYLGLVCNAYSVSGCGNVIASRFSIWLWLGIILLGVEGVLYLMAYPGLRDHKKDGWNYLFYGALLNLVYAVVSLFSSYNVVGSFLGALVGSAIGFYLLFQVRDAYTGKKDTASPDSSPKA
ncbi:MAG TPA: hypothetical protein VLE99_03535 [Candidatus Saccharimonadales bacterium]|nr:hypothetical protein [Candidatus Saccharimonadales bacterium]